MCTYSRTMPAPSLSLRVNLKQASHQRPGQVPLSADTMLCRLTYSSQINLILEGHLCEMRRFSNKSLFLLTHEINSVFCWLQNPDRTISS